MGSILEKTDMGKKTFENMAWQFYVDMLKQTPACLTEEEHLGSQPSEPPRFIGTIMNAVKSMDPGLTDMCAHAEIAVEQQIVPKVADGTWAGEAFAEAGADHLWNEYGQDMGSESRLR